MNEANAMQSFDPHSSSFRYSPAGDSWVTDLVSRVIQWTVRRHGLCFWPIEALLGFRRFPSLSTLLCSFPAHAHLLVCLLFQVWSEPVSFLAISRGVVLFLFIGLAQPYIKELLLIITFWFIDDS